MPDGIGTHGQTRARAGRFHGAVATSAIEAFRHGSSRPMTLPRPEFMQQRLPLRGAGLLRLFRRRRRLALGRRARGPGTALGSDLLLALIRQRGKLAGIPDRLDRLHRIARTFSLHRLGHKLLVLFDRHQFARLVPVGIGSAFGTAFLHPQTVSTLPHTFLEIVHGGSSCHFSSLYALDNNGFLCGRVPAKARRQPVTAGSTADSRGRLEAPLRIGVARKIATGSGPNSCASGTSVCCQLRSDASASCTTAKPSSANAASQSCATGKRRPPSAKGANSRPTAITTASRPDVRANATT